MDTSNSVNLRFISWNISSKKEVEPLLELLNELDGHIVALQQVTESGYKEFVDKGSFAWSEFSLDWRPPLATDGKDRRLGTAIFGRAPFKRKQTFLLDTAPWPERVLFAEVESPAGLLTVSSAHIPNGSKHEDEKKGTFTALAEWLADHPERMLVGIHTNAPEIDHPNLEQNKWSYEEEEKMMGITPPHALKDALRVWLEAHPREAAELYALRPRGALAISFDRGRGRTEALSRYDFIYVTSDFSVSHIHYYYDEGVRAGSDHAAVVSDLVFTPGKSK